MKKFRLAFYAMALATIALTSCEPGNKPGGNDDPDTPSTGVTGIKISNKTLELAEGESVRLQATVLPDGTKGTVTWTSSDTNVVYVQQNGSIEALSQGTALIIASIESFSDTCVVSVKSFLETLVFTGATYMDIDTLYYGQEDANGNVLPRIDTIQSTSGETYLAYFALCELWVFSDGFYINNSGYLDGSQEAAVITIQAPMYYTSNYLSNGQGGIVFILGDWAVDAEMYKQGYLRVGAPGAVDEVAYNSTMQHVFDALNANDASVSDYLEIAGTENITGATMTSWTLSQSESGETGYYYSYIPEGIVTSAIMSLNDDYTASKYMLGLDYNKILFTPIKSDYSEYIWGCKFTVNETTGYSMVDNKVYYGDPIVYEYGTMPTDAPQKVYKPLPVHVLKEENPQAAAQLKKQMKKMNLLHIAK